MSATVIQCFGFFSSKNKTLVHVATQIKKGSTARTRECDLIAPSGRYHKLLVFFLKRKVRIRGLGELNLCTTGSLDCSRLLLRTGARRRFQRSCLRLTSLSLSSLRRQEVKSEWKFKKNQEKFERPKNWIRPFLSYFETISNYYGLSFRTHFLRHFLSNYSKFQVWSVMKISWQLRFSSIAKSVKHPYHKFGNGKKLRREHLKATAGWHSI